MREAIVKLQMYIYLFLNIFPVSENTSLIVSGGSFFVFFIYFNKFAKY